MTGSDKNSKPSLLEPESRGGDTAEGGFSFQENVILSRITLWLSRDGFSAMVREAIGDAEAKFFIPGSGFLIEFLEVKNHAVSPSEFWGEIDRFQEIDIGSPGTYRWFTLASAGLSPALQPLVNGLRRVRDPYGFYEDGCAVKENSFADYLNIVRNLGRTEHDALFLFNKVLIDSDLSPTRSYGEALFRQSLTDHLPEYKDLPNRVISDIYVNLAAFIRGRRNQLISRIEIENKLRGIIDPKLIPPLQPVLIYTSIEDDKNFNFPGIVFEWEEFFGGEDRAYPTSERFNQRLMTELKETRDWIVTHRSQRRIKLTGSQRLSVYFAIGSIFSAVSGFSIEMIYRGESWPTDAHPGADTPYYPMITNTVEATGDQLVVGISILRGITTEVENNLKKHGLENMPRIYLTGCNAISSPQQANTAVRAIKDEISEALNRTKCNKVHLFYGGPAVLALFLGHRLNATAPIQCYEWVSTDNYVLSCLLFQ